MQTLGAGHLAGRHRAVEDQPRCPPVPQLWRELSVHHRNMASLPGSDIPALAAQLTVSDDLAAAAKKGKAAASRFPDAKIALQGRMAA